MSQLPKIKSEWYRELWIRLAQMEAEKLKAVELAVEEERRRVAEKKEDERRAVEQEREEAGRLRQEARAEREAGRAALQVVLLELILSWKTWLTYLALQGAHESQARQVELVNRLQVG